jgi:DNA-binding NarL/FixJ family response regulator
LAVLLNGTPGFVCAGAFGSGAALLENLAGAEPSVVLVDLELPGMGGVEFIRACRAEHPEVGLLVLTVHDEAEWVFPALAAGASGYVVKGTPPVKLLDAIAEVAGGGASMSGPIARLVLRRLRQTEDAGGGLEELSPRETEVLRCLSQGLRYDEIAVRLSVSARTVNSHLQRVYRKLHVHSATAAVARLHQSERQVQA